MALRRIADAARLFATGGNGAICSETINELGSIALKYATIGLMLLAAVVIGACTQGGFDASGERGDNSASPAGGEKSANQLGKSDTYDELRAGARLVLRYEAEFNTFMGRVENVTEAPLMRVRVKVHLSNGVELGPTPAVDLAPGESAAVALGAPRRPFDTWSAHAEVGDGE